MLEPVAPRFMKTDGPYFLESPSGSETRAVLPVQGEHAWKQGGDRGPSRTLSRQRHDLESGPRVSRADRTCGDAGEGSASRGQSGEACDASEPACVRPPSDRGEGQWGRGAGYAGENSYFPPPLPRLSDPPSRMNRFAVLQVEEAAEGADSTEQEQLGPGLGGAPVNEHRALVGDEGRLSTAEFGSSYRRRKRRKLRGALGAHASFLQFIFRRSTSIRPGCWKRGGLKGLVLLRPVTTFACRGGMNNAPLIAFEGQKHRGLAACGWYENYARLLQKLTSGVVPSALVLFCGQGGVTEGVRQAGGASHGQDLHPQPMYVSRFGDTTFTQGNSTEATAVADLRKRSRSFITMASPPCKAYSGARMRGAPSEEAMISQTRDVLRQAGGLYAIENVVGAKTDLRAGACQLRGSMFGLHVDRPRLFETNFELRVDEALATPGRALRCGCCMGFRRRVARLDPFGRPELRDCCAGNQWAPQGDKPFRCTLQECSAAMGVDVDHMNYDPI